MKNLSKWCYIFSAMVVWIPIILTFIQGKTMSRWMANRIIGLALLALILGIILRIKKPKNEA